MKKDKKDKSMSIVANINFIQDSFNTKPFKEEDFKKKSKTLKVPYPKDFLVGLTKKNKIEKLGKGLFKFKNTHPIFHFITEEIYKEASEKHTSKKKEIIEETPEKKILRKGIKKVKEAKESLEESILDFNKEASEGPFIDIDKFLRLQPVCHAVAVCKANDLKVLKPVTTYEEL